MIYGGVLCMVGGIWMGSRKCRWNWGYGSGWEWQIWMGMEMVDMDAGGVGGMVGVGSMVYIFKYGNVVGLDMQGAYTFYQVRNDL